MIAARACAEDLPPTRTEPSARYLVAEAFASDFLPEDDDEESEELFEDSFLSDDELSDEELSEDDSLLVEAPSFSFSRARLRVP